MPAGQVVHSHPSKNRSRLHPEHALRKQRQQQVPAWARHFAAIIYAVHMLSLLPLGQALHSRCFYEATAARHMAVPGVDMCNHSYEPNATVRLVHSPAACQGLDALEEVAPVAAAAACPSYFQLVAGEAVWCNVCAWVARAHEFSAQGIVISRTDCLATHAHRLGSCPI